MPRGTYRNRICSFERGQDGITLNLASGPRPCNDSDSVFPELSGIRGNYHLWSLATSLGLLCKLEARAAYGVYHHDADRTRHVLAGLPTASWAFPEPSLSAYYPHPHTEICLRNTMTDSRRTFLITGYVPFRWPGVVMFQLTREARLGVVKAV